MINLKHKAVSKSTKRVVYGYYVKFLDFTPATYQNEVDLERDIRLHTRHLIVMDGTSDYGMPRGLETVEVDPETLRVHTGIGNFYEGDYVVYDDKEYLIAFDPFTGFTLTRKGEVITNIEGILKDLKSL